MVEFDKALIKIYPDTWFWLWPKLDSGYDIFEILTWGWSYVGWLCGKFENLLIDKA